MALGALVAIVVIVLAATQLPRLFKTKAGGAGQVTQQTPSAATSPFSSPTQPANAGTNQQQTPSPASEPGLPSQAAASQGGTLSGQPGQPSQQLEGSSNPMAQTPATGSSKKRLGRGSQVEGAAHTGQMNMAGEQAGQAAGEAAPVSSQANQGAQAAAADAEAAKELEELGDRMTPLAGRANAMKDSVENLRQRQARAGYSLRPDISASLSRMEQYMDKTDAALNAHDPATAKKYMDLAEQEIENLEKFFGR